MKTGKTNTTAPDTQRAGTIMPFPANTSSPYEEAIRKLTESPGSLLNLNLKDIELTREQLEDLYSKVQNNSSLGHISWGDLPDGGKANKLKDGIESKLIQNNQQFKYHPTDFIHGLLCLHANKHAKELTEGKKVEFFTPPAVNTGKGAGAQSVVSDDFTGYNKHLTDWQVGRVFHDPEAKTYYGVSYINNQTRQMVLTHSAKFELNDLLSSDSSAAAGLKGVIGGEVVAQQAISYDFTKQIVDEARANNYHLSITGHGLGAWLAEFSLYFSHRDFDYKKAKVISFDSPGSFSNMDSFKSNIISHATEFEVKNLDITHYLSAPNFINSCNQHVGKAYRIFPEVNKPQIIDKIKGILVKIPGIEGKMFLLEGLMSLSGHQLEPILKVFDPATGKAVKAQEVRDWPHIKFTPNKEFGTDAVKAVIDLIPGSSVMPDFAKNFISSKVAGLASNIGAVNLINSIGEILTGEIAGEQYWATFEFLDHNKAKEGYPVKGGNLSNNKDNFSLNYEGHYRIKDLDTAREILVTDNKGSADWYLGKLAQRGKKQLGDGIIKIQLEKIKDQYKIKADGKKYIQLKDNAIFTIEELKSQILRLVEVNEKAEKILQYGKIIEQATTKGVLGNYVIEQVKNFVGREKVLKDLEDILDDNQVVAVHAFGGTGKTSVALKYAHQRKNEQGYNKQIVRWFAADSEEKLEAAYRDLGKELKVADESIKEKNIVINLINGELENYQSLLFVFDNVEKYEDVKGYITNLPPQVKVIITTRSARLHEENPEIQTITLTPFSIEDAEIYVKEALSDRKKLDTKDIIRLIEKVGSITKEGITEILPIKLSKAVAYLKEEMLTVEEYIAKHAGHGEHAETDMLLNLLSNTKPMADADKETNLVAWQALQYAARLDPDFINLEVFLELLTVSRKQLITAIKRLESLSLFEQVEHDVGIGVRMHRLVQKEVINYTARHPEQSLTEINENLIKSLDNLFPAIDYNMNQDWQQARLLYSHISKILDSAGVKNTRTAEQASLYNKLGKYHENISCKYKQSQEYYETALKIRQELHQGNHPDIAESLRNIGVSYNKLGNYKKALEYHEPALKMYKELYRGNHAEIATSLDKAGFSYQFLPDNKKALEYNEQALKMRQELYQGNHPDIAVSLNNVGLSYDRLDDYKKSLEYDEQALKMKQELYRGNHPETATSLNNIGFSYNRLGDYKKSLEYYELGLKMYQELYQGNHPDIAVSLNNIGTSYYNLGDYKKSLEYHEQALKMRQELYQGNHPDIAVSLGWFGYINDRLGDYKKSLEYHEQALKMRQELFQDNHPDITNSLNNVNSARNKLQQQETNNISSANISADKADKKEELSKAPEVNKASITEAVSKVDTGIATEKAASLAKAVSDIKPAGSPAQKAEIDITIKAEEKTTAVLPLSEKKATAKALPQPKAVSRFADILKLINEKTLKIVEERAGQGEWKDKLPAYMEVEDYLKDDYLRNKLGLKKKDKSLTTLQKLEDAKIIIFKHICVGIKDKHYSDLSCVKGFAQKYPELTEKIAGEYPEYFIHERIASACVNETQPQHRASLLKALEQNYPALAKSLAVYAIEEEIIARIDVKQIEKKAEEGEWKKSAKLIGMEVEEFAETKYLQKNLKLPKKDNSPEALEKIDHARTIIFKHICIGIMDARKKDFTCAEEFAKAYPDLTKKIAKEHPEYFIDASIVTSCIKDHQLQDHVISALRKQITGNGLYDHEGSSYWYQYAREAMEKMLELRLEAAGLDKEDVKTVTPDYVWDGSKRADIKLGADILASLKSADNQQVLIQLNLYGKHWVGLTIDSNESDITLSYMDSEQNKMPELLKASLAELLTTIYPELRVKIVEDKVEMQKYNNCGLEVIENLVSHVTGMEKPAQEDVLPIHSLLLGDMLLGGEISY